MITKPLQLPILDQLHPGGAGWHGRSYEKPTKTPHASWYLLVNKPAVFCSEIDSTNLSKGGSFALHFIAANLFCVDFIKAIFSHWTRTATAIGAWILHPRKLRIWHDSSILLASIMWIPTCWRLQWQASTQRIGELRQCLGIKNQRVWKPLITVLNKAAQVIAIQWPKCLWQAVHQARK